MSPDKKPSFACLIIEDDESTADAIAAAVELEGGNSIFCRTIQEARGAIFRDFQLIITDNYLPDGKGEEFFSFLRFNHPDSPPCIMLTGFPELPSAVRLTRDGLFDYLTKPLDPNELRIRISRAVDARRKSHDNLRAFGIVAQSAAMRLLGIRISQAVSNPTTTVLITGETGTGKDVVARLIHQMSFEGRPHTPSFLSLNCSTLPAELFEAELFGTQKGSFTGAHQNRIGLAQAASGGTLFLDEIGEVPLTLQAKLLHLLERREFRPLGSNQTLVFEGRIIAATNKDLEEEVKQNRFREDLWYRLNVLDIKVPPLRERVEDIPFLVDTLLGVLCRKSERAKPHVKPQDMQLLSKLPYPGNVRELRNILERALIATPHKSNWLELDVTSIKGGQPSLDAGSSGAKEYEYRLVASALTSHKSIRAAADTLRMSHQALLRRLNKWPELRQLFNSRKKKK